MTYRNLNILTFAQQNYPDEFQNYINQFDDITLPEIEKLLLSNYPLYVRAT